MMLGAELNPAEYLTRCSSELNKLDLAQTEGPHEETSIRSTRPSFR